MSDYTAHQILRQFWSIEEGMVRSFLIEGDDSAMLVDTGACGGALREFCRTLTSRPVFVVTTHADRDHIAAHAQFDLCYMHPEEFAYFQMKGGNAEAMRPIWEGDTLAVGAYTFEVIHIPGHTPGSIALLEHARRFLIGGDSVQQGNIFMFGPGRDFPAYIASMEKLNAASEAFHTVYASHGPLEVPSRILPALIAGAKAVMAGEIEGTDAKLPFPMPAKLYACDGVYFLAD